MASWISRWFGGARNNNSSNIPVAEAPKPHEDLKSYQAHNSITYSPTLIKSLEADHNHLVVLFSSIEQMITEQRFHDVPDALGEFKTKLDVHLLTENLRFYCYLEQSLADYPNELEIMKDFRREMNGIARVVVNFVRKWQQAVISNSNKHEFLSEYGHIGSALTQRIEREENGLYTLYTS